MTDSASALVVFLPGIGGTCLAVPGIGPTADRLVWSASLADLGLFRHPERLAVEEHSELVPVGLVPTRKAFGAFTTVPGYDGAFDALATTVTGLIGGGRDDGTGPVPNLDATAVAFGYDFRLGVAAAAHQLHESLASRVSHLWPGSEHHARRRVVLVGHSMGGLVARYWAARFDDHRWCRAVVTLGTPHRGAPKALEVLANGIPLRGGFHIGRFTDVLRGWQGGYDLLPRYPAVLDTTSTPAGGSEQVGGVPPPRLRPEDLELGWAASKVSAAAQMHRDLEEGWLGLGVEAPGIHPRVGFGHATLARSEWDGRRVRVSKQPDPGHGLGGWTGLQGDGTVPGFCAMPVERGNDSWDGLTSPLRHGPISGTPVRELLRPLLRPGSLDEYRALGGQVSLGVDVEEILPVGETFPVMVSVWHRDHENITRVATLDQALGLSNDTDVWATLRVVQPDGALGPPASDTRLTWDPMAKGYIGTLPAQQSGLVELTVNARSLTDTAASQTLEVVSNDLLN